MPDPPGHPRTAPWRLHAAFWLVLAESVVEGAVVAVYALVLSSLHAFPTPELPRS